MLADAKSDCRATYCAMLLSHSVPNLDYIRIRYLRRRHACGTVNHIVITREELRQYVELSVSVSLRHVYVQLITDRALATFHYSEFHIMLSTNLKLNALLSQHRLECCVQKLSASICSHPGRTSAYWFRIICEYRTKCIAHGCTRL